MDCPYGNKNKEKRNKKKRTHASGVIRSHRRKVLHDAPEHLGTFQPRRHVIFLPQER
jgi:hypothetical protein